MNSDGKEKKTLSVFLAAQRASVLAIVDGLDAQALTTSVLPSGWTPLGLIEHRGTLRGTGSRRSSPERPSR